MPKAANRGGSLDRFRWAASGEPHSSDNSWWNNRSVKQDDLRECQITHILFKPVSSSFWSWA